MDRQLAEHRLAKESDQVISIEETREAWQVICGATRRMFDELPGRMEAALPGRLTAHDRKVMARITRDAQIRLADELRDGALPGAIGPDDLMPAKERK